ncbi:MAG: FG-GAP repeat domain-containing protein, partial [bacterium]
KLSVFLKQFQDAVGRMDTYSNNGDGTFTKITTSVVNDGGPSIAGSWGDFNNDGKLDLFVTNANNNLLYRNDGNGAFSKVTSDIVVNDRGSGGGASWSDFDNDGDLELFVANRANTSNFLYTNNGDGTFTKITTGDVVSDIGFSDGGSWQILTMMEI